MTSPSAITVPPWITRIFSSTLYGLDTDREMPLITLPSACCAAKVAMARIREPLCSKALLISLVISNCCDRL